MDSSAHFSKQLQIGKTGETEIATWLLGRGHGVLPIYEIAENQYKGPALYSGDNTIIAPDMMTIKNGKVLFVEAKHKEGFTWYRRTASWQTGIDIKHFNEYMQIEDVTKIPVWILFLQKGGYAKDSEKSPAGLYGNSLAFLKNNTDHFSDRHGKSGMVYWDIRSLIKLDNYPLDKS